MADEQKAKLRLEIAHVLFMDIVGYSKLLTDEQSEALQELNQIVRSTEAAREAEAAGRLTVLPTGDGMALVFTGSVEEPVECALEISQALRVQPSLPVRMGIHSGPIHHVKDANGRENIAGVGINIAQRVMDCGDAGHILVSKRVADDLAQQRRWQPYLHELGDAEVKHGVVVSLVNLYAETIGNPTQPSRLRKVRGSIPGSRAGTHKALSPLALAIFAVAVLLLVLAIVSVILAPAIMHTLDQGRLATPPQPSATASPSLADTIKSAVAKKITDELQDEFSRKKNGAVEPTPTGSTIPEKSIAILPFENLSDDKSAAYFADGIQDEILTKLASIADLKVISRTSTVRYKSKPEDLKTVSQQLGVANVLEGTVQKAADNVRVNVQLIDARADSHLWARSYDRDIKDIFEVESEVAQQIADSLQAKLSPAEAKTLATVPTRDSEAYDFFLKGEFEEREAESSFRPESYDQAESWYRKAIERDPNFALAIARLVNNRMQRHWFVASLSEAELAEVAKTADKAVALAPGLAEPHIARGIVYYFGHRQYDNALVEFRAAIKCQPNNSRALEYCGYVHRRQGKWRQCLSELTDSEVSNPQDAATAGNIATAYDSLRMWKEANTYGTRSLTINPHDLYGMRAVLDSYLNGEGDIKEARRILQTFPPDANFVFDSIRGNLTRILGHRAYLSVLERDFPTALSLFDSRPNSPFDEHIILPARAAIHVLAPGSAVSSAEIERARGLLEERLRQRPADSDAMAQLSWVYLALGHNRDAIEQAHKAATALSLDKDAIGGAVTLSNLAAIEARASEPGKAIDHLRYLLSIPAGADASIARLKIDPVWDPIRDRPDFQQLLTVTEHVGP
jgi:TolB-like protein/Tfp pilus assembly protein PilF